MVGSPADIHEEIKIVKETIQTWNNINAEKESIILLPLHWTTNSYPTTGTHPQKAINKQLVAKSDMLICIFGARLGSPTDSSESGTIEEIEEHLKAEKPVMIFFKKSISDIDSIDPEQLERLKSFKNSIQSNALYKEYLNADDFKRIFSEKLQLSINDHFVKVNNILPLNNPVNYISIEKQFSYYEKERLKEWVESKSNIAQEYSVGRGLSKWLIGDKQYAVNSAKENAEYNDFFKRLLEEGYVETTHDSKGNKRYKLTMKGYSFVETF